MPGTTLVVVEHDRGELAPATLEALTAARSLDAEIEALSIGAAADSLVSELAAYGVSTVHQAHDDLLIDYGPETWGEVVAQAVRALSPAVVLATGTDRGNEVLAQAAARLDLHALFLGDHKEICNARHEQRKGDHRDENLVR